MKARSFFFFFFASVPLVALLALAGCAETKGSSSGASSGQPPAVSNGEGGVNPQTGVVRYLSLGDSLSQGVGATDPATGSFPALVSEKWRTKGCKVELNNPAISGYKAEDIIQDELPEIATFKPTLITLQVGANDIANGVTLDTYRKNVRTILDAAKGSGARVLVMPQNEWFRSPQGVTYGPGLPEKRAEFDAALIEEANSKGAEIVDLRLMFKQHADKNLWIDDGIHPTPEAYAEWATELARVVPSPCGK